MESKNAQGQIGRKSKLSRLLSLKWMDVFCLSKENVASIQGGRRSKQEILNRWGSTLLWADLVQGCSATPKQFASVPLLKSSFQTKPSLPVPPFSTIHWDSAFRSPAGCSAWLVAQGTPFQSLPQPPLCSTELWHCPVLTEMRALGWAFAAQVKSPRATGERSEPISFSKFQFKSHLCNLWDRSVKGSVGVPWHEGQPLFYFQQLLWKQLVLHELFAFQS